MFALHTNDLALFLTHPSPIPTLSINLYIIHFPWILFNLLYFFSPLSSPVLYLYCFTSYFQTSRFWEMHKWLIRTIHHPENIQYKQAKVQSGWLGRANPVDFNVVIQSALSTAPTLTNGGFMDCFSGMLRRLEWLALLLTSTSGERVVSDFKPAAPGDLSGASLAVSATQDCPTWNKRHYPNCMKKVHGFVFVILSLKINSRMNTANEYWSGLFWFK